MQITATKNKDNKSDTFTKSNNIVTINGTDYDLDNLNEKPIPVTDENGTVTNQSEIDSFADRCYLENEVKYIKIEVDNQNFFDFVNNNYMLFFDTDLNGDISDTELDALVIHYNLDEVDRVKNRKAIIAGFGEEEWKTKRIACGQTVK